MTNQKDTYALSGVALRSKEFLEVEELDVLADKGCHTGSKMKKCAENNIRTFISPKDTSIKSKPVAYRKDRFIYNAEDDTGSCGEKMAN